DDLHGFVGDDVGGGDDAALVPIDADGARLLAGVLHHQALDVEDDVGDILDDAGNRGDLVLHALDLDTGDGTAFEAGQKDTAQAVADGHAEAALERLGVELAVGVREGLTLAGDAVGQFEATPFDTHVKASFDWKETRIEETRIEDRGSKDKILSILDPRSSIL